MVDGSSNLRKLGRLFFANRVWVLMGDAADEGGREVKEGRKGKEMVSDTVGSLNDSKQTVCDPHF